MKVAVIAHAKKQLGGGLKELRRLLRAAGIRKPLWYEIAQSQQARRCARKALRRGAKLVFVWGGDGTVQRCVDALAGEKAALAVLPAGTANLFAKNLGVPTDLAQAVEIGLHGTRRKIDVGRINGEHFACFAGVGFDGVMIRNADGEVKRRLGRLAYFRSSLAGMHEKAVGMRVKVDGKSWFSGKASCLLLGNVGTVTGGFALFPDATLDSGALEVGVATAEGVVDWMRVFGRVLTGHGEQSPFVHLTRGRRIKVRLAHALPYELDGSYRGTADRLQVRILPGAITCCVPPEKTESEKKESAAESAQTPQPPST